LPPSFFLLFSVEISCGEEILFLLSELDKIYSGEMAMPQIPKDISSLDHALTNFSVLSNSPL
jgi:hypothetical protein